MSDNQIKECSVCVETFNKSTRKKIECNFCSFSSCRCCVSRYLLENSADPHCMSCKHEWNPEFMLLQFPKTFMNKTYKTHRENVLLEREKSLLPSALVVLESEKEKNAVRDEINDIKRQIRELYLLKEQKEKYLWNLKHRDGSVTNTKEQTKFIKQCPVQDCRGFLSTQWKCGICNVKVCKHCREIKPEHDEKTEHICNPALVESIQAMGKDTKDCPGCGTPTFKINGCSQMFCTIESCHTAWNWNTRKIETGIIHNPHYYEWQRQSGGNIRNVRDVQCGGLVFWHDFQRNLRTIYRCPEEEYVNQIQQFHQRTTHYRVILENQYNNLNYNPQLDMDLRLKYLNKEIDEEKWKVLLQRRHKKRTKNRIYRDILTTFTAVMTDYLNDFHNTIRNQRFNNPPTIEDYKALIQKCKKILHYCNQQIEKTNKMFGSKMKVLTL